MRILKISDVYFPRINGVSTSIQTFTEEFVHLGHEVTLIAPRYTEQDEEHEQLIRIPSRQLPFDPEDRLFNRSYVMSLAEQLKHQQFDIIHIETPFSAHFAGLKLAKELNIPTVETYHTHFEEYFYHYLPLLPKFVLKFIARKINRWQCNNVDSIIVPSQAMLDILNEYGVNKPIQIIPTGMHERFFRQGNGLSFRKQHNIPINRPVLVHIGRVAHEKNIDFLLHMTKELKNTVPDILLLIAGEGPALNYLKDLSERLGLQDNVMFFGYLDRDTELLDCYAAGDVFVFASRTETQGLVLLEAMAQSVPVVSTAKLGTIDILSPEKGAIISEEDIDEFSDKVSKVLFDNELQSKLQLEAKPYAESWSAKQMAIKALEFYQKTIEQNL